jgi:hypothetical protein
MAGLPTTWLSADVWAVLLPSADTMIHSRKRIRQETIPHASVCNAAYLGLDSPDELLTIQGQWKID